MQLSEEAGAKSAKQQTPVVDLSIVIPCFNESDTIRNTVAAVEDYIQLNYSDLNVEIIFINDGSTDDTGKVLSELSASLVLRNHHHSANQGRGAAIRTGINASRGNLVICLDADLSYDVEHIGDILGAFNSNPGTDTVVVSAYMKGGSVQNVPWSRLFLSRAANRILCPQFKNRLSTVTCVVRGYKGDLLRSLHLTSEGKELHLEILHEMESRNARILEIPGRLMWSAGRRKTPLRFYDVWKHLKTARLRPPHGSLTTGKVS